MKGEREMNNEKLKVLKRYLMETKEIDKGVLEGLTVENSYNEHYGIFEINGNEYRVLTDEEADEQAETEIKESLWAFNPQFILEHTEFYEDSTEGQDKEFIKGLRIMQERLCESANSMVRALIKNINWFVDDAIEADGRGHFISWYDGEEIEKDGYYIYRIN